MRRTRPDIRELRKQAAKRAYIESMQERGEMLSKEKAAQLLGISENTLKTMACNGEVPSYKHFGRRVYFRNEFLKYIEFSMLRGAI